MPGFFRGEISHNRMPLSASSKRRSLLLHVARSRGSSSATLGVRTVQFQLKTCWAAKAMASRWP